MPCHVCGRELILFDENENGYPFGYVCPAWEAYYREPDMKHHPSETDLEQRGISI